MKSREQFLADCDYQVIWYNHSCHFLHQVINIYKKRVDNQNKSIIHDIVLLMQKSDPEYKISWVRDSTYFLRISGQEIREDKPIYIMLSLAKSFKPTKTFLLLLQKELKKQEKILQRNIKKKKKKNL